MKKYLSSWYWIDKLNKHKSTSSIYVFLKKHIRKSEFKLEQLSSPEPTKSNSTKRRVTIILPSLRRSKVFGGVSTALKFFDKIIFNGNFEGRIVVIGNEKYDPELTIQLDEFITSKVETIFLDRNQQVSVRKNDFFIYTTWKSAYIFEKIVEWQREIYNIEDRKSIYLIQDYEPGFVPWSSEFALADSTYHVNEDKKIAVFNSRELYQYFKFNNYTFAKEIFFKPVLNEKLKQILLKDKGTYIRKKQIIIYGRPNEPRNAYEILKESLVLWSKKYPSASEWSIVSLGAPNKDIKLDNNIIECKGKVSLDEYADIMLHSYAGISLMISPHPSYPPLEMSTFGVKTITNKFMNKNLEKFNKNLFSIESCIPTNICDELIKICDNYDKKGAFDFNQEYLYGNDFDNCVTDIIDYIKE